MDENRTKSLSPWKLTAMLLVLVIPLYVLSVGPVLYLSNNGFPSLGKSLEGFYSPLVWVAEQWRPLDYALKRYIAWWLT
jgi:hypothetical protein